RRERPVSARREVAIVSVSMDLGAGRRGVDMGPSAIRLAGLTETINSLGCPVREVGTVTASGPEMAPEGESRTRYLDEITDVARRSLDLVRLAAKDGALPLVLGGDHSISIGTVAALAAGYRERGQRIGLLWVDAHTDMN